MEDAAIKRIQPHNIEAEQAVLGSIFLNNETMNAAIEILKSEDFYQRQYGLIFDAMLDLYNAGKVIDVITVQDKLREKDIPAELASMDSIRELLDMVPTSTNIRQHAKIVADKSVLRKLIKVTEGITSECYTDRENVEDILNHAETNVFSLIQAQSKHQTETIRETMVKVINSIDAASKNKSGITGVETGFYDLDAMTAGFQKSDLIIVGARPAMGKTAFVLNIAEFAAVKHDVTTAVFNLEMSSEQLAKRVLAMNSRVDSQKIKTGMLDVDDWDKVIESAALIGDSHLIIDDTPGINVTELRSKCLKMKLEHNLGMVIIDYLQLMSPARRSDSRQQEMQEISRALKLLARELNVPVIALSQLSRTVEQRTDKRPMMSDLRESGAIEQDADIVMFLYRDDYYNPDTDEKGVAEVIIAKQRSGSLGKVKLIWEAQLTKFLNMERGQGYFPD